MEGGAWRATVHRTAKSQTRLKRLRYPNVLVGKKYCKIVFLYNPTFTLNKHLYLCVKERVS